MEIKFMTFNIQHCNDYVKQVIDIDLMAGTIKKCQAEIIGLNEVFGDKPNQVKIISDQLGYYHFFGQAIIYPNEVPYGNAIISKYPFKSVETILIPDPIRNTNEFYETRCIIKAEFENPNLTVLISHFGLAKSEQENAVETVTRLIKSIKTPIVFMGDLNMMPDDPKLKPINDLLVNTLPENQFTFPSINPTRKIDYIFVSKDIEVIDALIPNIVASDHFPHTATLRFK